MKRIARASTSEQRMVQRARTVLLAAAGWRNDEIGPMVSLSAHKVSKWRRRFAEERRAEAQGKSREKKRQDEKPAHQGSGSSSKGMNPIRPG